MVPSTSSGEPTTLQGAFNWIQWNAQKDRFARLIDESHRHRAQHRCTVYPSSDGPVLGVLAAAAGAKRILELGCGLGYSALWLALGAGDDAAVETIEGDSAHAAMARRNFAAEKLDDRVRVLEGQAAAVMENLTAPYDLIYFDGDPAEAMLDLDFFERLLRRGGMLISANLFLGVYDPNIPGLEQTAQYRRRIMDPAGWLTTWINNGGKALSIRR